MSADLMSVEEAINALLNAYPMKATPQAYPLLAANNLVLAEDVIAPIGIPLNHLSMMDGYAIRAQDYNHNTPLKVTQRIAAGMVADQPLAAGTAARIFTGAMLPEGADTIVMQEDCQQIDDEHIRINIDIIAGQFVRLANSEIAKDSLLLHKGTRLTAQAIGLAASVGIATLPCYKPLSVALVMTGSELVQPGQPLTAGKTYNANQYLLASLLNNHGYQVEIIDIVEDSLNATVESLKQAAVQDIIISTGGVSVGEEDHIRTAVAQLGTIDAWKVKMKPGKPFTFGQVLNTAFFGLPGNPVSAFVTFHLFVLPTLKQMQGITHIDTKTQQVVANFDFNASFRREYLRVQLVDDQGVLKANLHANQNSSALASTHWADGLAIAMEDSQIRTGDTITYIPFHAF